MNLLQTVLTYTAFPFATTIVGGTIATFKPPDSGVKSYIQHFAAGVVFAAAASELLPAVMQENLPWAIVLGGLLGVIFLLSVKYLTMNIQGAFSLIAIVGADVLIDGLILGLGFVVGVEAGILLTGALTLELLFLGLSVSSALIHGDTSRFKTIAITAGIALLLPMGAGLGSLLSGLSNFVLTSFFSFGLVTLLYLVTEELLVEAHEKEDTPLTTATFFVGFLLLIVLEELL